MLKWQFVDFEERKERNVWEKGEQEALITLVMMNLQTEIDTVNDSTNEGVMVGVRLCLLWCAIFFCMLNIFYNLKKTQK